jgi:hypothetical protein
MEDSAAPEAITPTYHTAPEEGQKVENMDAAEKRRLEEEWYKQTGELTGSLAAEVEARANDPDYEVTAPTVPGPTPSAQPSTAAPFGQLDLTDLRGVDFVQKRLYVGTVWFELSESDLWKLANIAVQVIQRLTTESLDKAANQFLQEGSDATTREEVQRVQGTEATEPVPPEPEGEGQETGVLQDVQEGVERPETGAVQPEVENDAEGDSEPSAEQPRLPGRGRTPPGDTAD